MHPRGTPGVLFYSISRSDTWPFSRHERRPSSPNEPWPILTIILPRALVWRTFWRLPRRSKRKPRLFGPNEHALSPLLSRWHRAWPRPRCPRLARGRLRPVSRSRIRGQLPMSNGSRRSNQHLPVTVRPQRYGLRWVGSPCWWSGASLQWRGLAPHRRPRLQKHPLPRPRPRLRRPPTTFRRPPHSPIRHLPVPPPRPPSRPRTRILILSKDRRTTRKRPPDPLPRKPRLPTRAQPP